MTVSWFLTSGALAYGSPGQGLSNLAVHLYHLESFLNYGKFLKLWIAPEAAIRIFGDGAPEVLLYLKNFQMTLPHLVSSV